MRRYYDTASGWKNIPGSGKHRRRRLPRRDDGRGNLGRGDLAESRADQWRRGGRIDAGPKDALGVLTEKLERTAQ